MSSPGRTAAVIACAGALLAACSSSPSAEPITAEEAAAAIDDSGIACQTDSAANHIATSGAWQEIDCGEWSLFIGNPGEIDRLLSTDAECQAQQAELSQELADNPDLASDSTVVAAVGPNWDAYYGDGSTFPWDDPEQASAGSVVLTDVADALGGLALTPVETIDYWLQYNGCEPLGES